MRVPHWIGLSLWAACAYACAGASDGETADQTTADQTTADHPQGAGSPCADAGANVIGADDGDRIESINGYDVADPQAALEAFSHLRADGELTVEINRRGCPTNLQIPIR
jgi:hypothetical protein